MPSLLMTKMGLTTSLIPELILEFEKRVASRFIVTYRRARKFACRFACECAQSYLGTLTSEPTSELACASIGDNKAAGNPLFKLKNQLRNQARCQPHLGHQQGWHNALLANDPNPPHGSDCCKTDDACLLYTSPSPR